jgi:phage protein U
MIGKPGSQHVGGNLDTLTLQIRLHKYFTDPDLELAKMDEYKKRGTILPFITGDGRIIGDFYIKGFNISFKQLGPDGLTLFAEVSLDLKEYYTADRDAAAKNDSINNGFANSQNTPQQTIPTETPGTPSMEASKSVVSSGASISAVSDMSDILSDASGTLKNTCEQMKTKCVSALNDTQKIIGIIDADASSELYSVTRDLSTSCTNQVSILTNLVNSISQLITDITGNPAAVPAGIITVGEDVQDAMDNMEQIRAHATKMAAMAALKK